jgi:maltose alpha-D-glucosyltransferase/alpha-amylase
MAAIPQKAMSDLWWKNAIFYCLDVETFLDSDGDGVGDFPGLTSRIDYLAGLGVTCLWLLPFYPTPNRDDGYDVSDYYGVDPRLGSLGDFVELVRTAHERGIRVMIDLVVNHTSDQHAWFKQASRDPGSPYRDFYVWSDRPLAQPSGPPIFPGEQDGYWTYSERAGQYYLHRFHDYQPDLNIANPDVRDEIHKITGFWLELGVSGFRIDAAPFVIEQTGIGDDPLVPDAHAYLRDLRAFVGRRRGDAALVGEVNEPGQEQARFFGEDDEADELQLLFNFMLNNALILSLAQQRAEPLERCLRELPSIPVPCQWLNFLRVHDELNLDRLAPRERKEAFGVFAPEEDMLLYGRGLRRRIPPMLGGLRSRIESAYSLLFALPGAPLLLWGEELGMGDDLSQPARLSVRTPMQWSRARNGGFSTAPRRKLVRPLVDDPLYGPERVNVADERRDPSSLLEWFTRLVRVRRETPELGWGTCSLVETAPPTVVAHRCDWSGGTVLAAHNLGPEAAEVALDPDGDLDGATLVTILGETRDGAESDSTTVALDGYGYRWLRVRRPDDVAHFP